MRIDMQFWKLTPFKILQFEQTGLRKWGRTAAAGTQPELSLDHITVWKRLDCQHSLIQWYCEAILCISQSTNIRWMALQQSQREGEERWEMARQTVKAMRWEGIASLQQTQSWAWSRCMCSEGWTMQGAPCGFCCWRLQSRAEGFAPSLLGESWRAESWLSAVSQLFTVLSRRRLKWV